jgi:deoxyxylulose-5-phosphate synthase
MQIYSNDEEFSFAKAKYLKKATKPFICLIGIGITIQNCIEAFDLLPDDLKNQVSVVDAIFAKPIDESLFSEVYNNHSYAICVEEGSIGGLATILLEFFHSKNTNPKFNYSYTTLPDKFIEHNTTQNIHNFFNMSSKSILLQMMKIFDKDFNHKTK